jgi:ribosome biogenesis GTPase / thiamine phosphate phosphatase
VSFAEGKKAFAPALHRARRVLLSFGFRLRSHEEIPLQLAQFDSLGASRIGTVHRKSQGEYDVFVDGQVIPCSISSKLRKQLIYPIADPGSLRHRVQSVEDIRAVDPIAIGDVVRLQPAGPGRGAIIEVLPRRNSFVRRAAGKKPLTQVIMVNVDQVVAVVSAARPAVSWELMDRYLAAAEKAGVPALIVVTKLDLVDPAELAGELATYLGLNYPVFLTSGITGIGLAELRHALLSRVSIITGKSGVGKTTLLNQLQPGLGLRVNDVSELTGKGKHTTSHLEMFPLDGGGAIVDTPGMREFGLPDVSRHELSFLFRELAPLVGRCRFGLDCSHLHEPGCAIKQAVQEGNVSVRRYESYLRMTKAEHR